MSKHTMRLRREPFEKIKSGKKTVELRLYDEKRQQIQVGDTICFVHTEDETDTITTQVENLFVFASFEELYQKLPLTDCGYTAEELSAASPRDMEQYYSKEEQGRYGVVGIQIRPVNG